MKLTRRRQAFVQYVAQGDTYSEAYERAGYKANKSAASRMASELVCEIEEARRGMRLKIQELAAIEKLPFVEDLARLATSNIDDYYTAAEKGPPVLKAWEDIPPEARRAIKGLKISKDGRVDVELYDRLAALEKLKAWLWGPDKLVSDDEKRAGLEDKVVIEVIDSGRIIPQLEKDTDHE